MPLQVIKIGAANIDDAAGEIIGFLGRTRQQGDVIYLDGFFGLGASAILNAVVERLRSPTSGATTRKALGVDKIIHIDCLLWQSKRSLQKAIAKELKLPQEVMAFFDKSDEEDDFYGVQQAARCVIPHVKWAIMDELINSKFLVVFHNGSGSYVDLWEYGVPVTGAMRGKRVLWTSRGRFFFRGVQYDEMEGLAGLSDMAIAVRPQIVVARVLLWHLMHAEAKEVARYSGLPDQYGSKVVLECILYKMLREGYNIDWDIHAANYWVCAGIIQDANDSCRSAWEIGDALHRNMNIDWNRDNILYILEVLLEWRQPNETRFSATCQHPSASQVSIASSFWRDKDIIQGGNMFGDIEICLSVRVLHLYECTFSFSSPPFLSCSNLRFLLLDHCKDNKNDYAPAADRGEEQDNSSSQAGGDGRAACFQKLWVLELSYTCWHWLLSKRMLDLMGELRELNVKGPGNWSLSHLHSCSGARSNSLLKLRVVGGPAKEKDNIGSPGDHRNQEALSSFPDLSSWNILKTVVLDGCVDLEEIDSNTLPPSLESFSFVTMNNVDSTEIKRISFRGCAMMKSLLLRKLFVHELDMSGTSFETLDLSEMRYLMRLFLLGCQKLRAILWPDEENWLEVLRIDTTHAAWSRQDKSNKQEATRDLDSYISLTDPRLFRSLLGIRLGYHRNLHVEISSTGGQLKVANQGNNNIVCGGSQQEMQGIKQPNAGGNLYADDIISAFKDNPQTPAINWSWPYPPIPSNRPNCCYIRIQEETPTELLRGMTTSTKQVTLPSLVHNDARALHLHDSLSITCIPGPAPPEAGYFVWRRLEWCKLERCPNLEGLVFTAPSLGTNISYISDTIFVCLETFWASQLLKARYIWDWSAVFRPDNYSFENLVFLHLDYCPRLVHVLPLYTSNGFGCRNLETLEIICCGELREVFPSDSESQQQQQEPRLFPRLKRIHLHELPALHHIYRHRMLAPELETVEIRGCWSLKRLPAVCRAELLNSDSKSKEEEITPRRSTPPSVDCEKDWWDGLEWDGEEAGHHPSHYKPTHSAFYKKTMLRPSVLR